MVVPMVVAFVLLAGHPGIIIITEVVVMVVMVVVVFRRRQRRRFQNELTPPAVMVAGVSVLVGYRPWMFIRTVGMRPSSSSSSLSFAFSRWKWRAVHTTATATIILGIAAFGFSDLRFLLLLLFLLFLLRQQTLFCSLCLLTQQKQQIFLLPPFLETFAS